MNLTVPSAQNNLLKKAWSLLPLAWFALVRLLAGRALDQAFWQSTLLLILFFFGLAVYMRPDMPSRRWVAVLGLTLGADLLIQNFEAGLGWNGDPLRYPLLLAVVWLLVLALWIPLGAGQRWWQAVLAAGALSLAAGAAAAAGGQLESRFSDEEFVAALEALALAGGWLTFCLAWKLGWQTFPHDQPLLDRWRRLGIWLGLLVSALVIGGVLMMSYQASFSPREAPRFDGISAEQPFTCLQSAPEAQTYDGTEVYRRLLALVAANPYKGTPELGMLALGSGETTWQTAFHDALMAEARAGNFTGPAGSVKYGQYEAALRLYYLWKQPALFSAAEQAELKTWFAAVNRRALTVEWVDWMYALSLGRWPEGPYENQENGAGLLALLEVSGYADPALSAANRSYLDRNPRGWAGRFHNSDDAYLYQMEWINNAYFQSLYAPLADGSKRAQSFAWLLTQALPSGQPLGYNHPNVITAAGTAYFGAGLLNDESLLWMAGRGVDFLEAHGEPAVAQPGADAPLNLTGRAPQMGSCLLFSETGMPTALGPLAADKLVLRQGWGADDLTLLLNLRFTGWHRYKAANSLILAARAGETWIAEQNQGEAIWWLPKGRSAFRDKRVPRENLNAFQVAAGGWADLLDRLTGLGSPWAQDPPYLAEMQVFEQRGALTLARAALPEWHGWTSTRTLVASEEGPVLIRDTAQGKTFRRTAITWHINGQAAGLSGRYSLGSGQGELVLLGEGGSVFEARQTEGLLDVTCYPPAGRRLTLNSVVLPAEWVGAEVTLLEDGVAVAKDGKTLLLPFEP
ncbi:MAG TPA: hypothetical protein PKW33_16890 [Anaerolineaceae bacterium]|nr:hypothetical protein [Anaerolineaceae bacterium]HPN53276.1 hypothetical protein [Anaerolineaceae bacterium]